MSVTVWLRMGIYPIWGTKNRDPIPREKELTLRASFIQFAGSFTHRCTSPFCLINVHRRNQIKAMSRKMIHLAWATVERDDLRAREALVLILFCKQKWRKIFHEIGSTALKLMSFPVPYWCKAYISFCFIPPASAKRITSLSFRSTRSVRSYHLLAHLKASKMERWWWWWWWWWPGQKERLRNITEKPASGPFLLPSIPNHLFIFIPWVDETAWIDWICFI